MKQLRKLGAVGLCLTVAMVVLPNTGFAADFTGDPYTLDTCPVSGGKLGSMGDPIVLTVDNREFRICCAGCKAKITSDTASFVKDIDAKMVTAQLPYYPLETGLVSGKTLGPKAVNLIHFNRLVRLTDRNQAKKFRSDPEPYLAKLDAAVIKKQNADYPLKKCPVSGDKLTAMGKPIDVVIANRLVRTCCPGCVPGVTSDPLAAFANLDGEPIKAKGSHSKKKGDKDDGHDHEEGHDHDH